MSMVRTIFLFSGVSNLLNYHKGFKQPVCQGLQKEMGEVQICTRAPYCISPSSSTTQQEPFLITFCSDADGRGPEMSCCLCSVVECIKFWGSLYSHPVVNRNPQPPNDRGHRAATTQTAGQQREGCSLSLGTQLSSPVLAENQSVLLDRVLRPHSQM